MEKKSHQILDSHAIALVKLKKYCAYQERCHEEVRRKLISVKVYGDELEEIIIELINEDYLNEERYAKSYARGKFRMNKWGRNKILLELKRRKISDYCIRKGMLEIDDEEYEGTLFTLFEKALPKWDKLQKYQQKSKLYELGMRKGYEGNVISDVLGRLF